MIKALATKSGIIHGEKHLNNNVNSNETAESVKNFFTRPDIVCTMPCMKNEITI